MILMDSCKSFLRETHMLRLYDGWLLIVGDQQQPQTTNLKLQTPYVSA
jgi:hypothetical protein